LLLFVLELEIEVVDARGFDWSNLGTTMSLPGGLPALPLPRSFLGNVSTLPA